MKRAVVLVLVALCLLVCVPSCAFADTASDLQSEIENELDNLDFSDMEEVSAPFLQSFVQKVKQIINGEFDNTQNFFQLVGELFADNLSSLLPQLISIFCVLVVCGLARSTADGLISADTENVVSFVGLTVVVISVLSLAVEAYKQVVQALSQISVLADATMPMLLTFVVANGGNAVSSVCQPAMVVFSSFIINAVKNLLLPLSLFGMAFVVVSNLSANVRVSKMSDFFNNLSSWALGIMFMVFSAFTTVQGISAQAMDGVSYRAAKFAAKNYIPILGGYIADGFDIVVAGTSLIKNAVGAVAMLLVFLMVLKPLLTLVCVNLGLQAVSAVSEPIIDGKYIKLIGGISKSLTFLAVLVVAVAFMFCLLTVIVILSANGV